MSYADHAKRTGRIPCTVVEIDLDWIDDEAVAATNDDGSLCYRTPATTDQAALGDYTLTTRTRRFMTATQRPIPELGAIPCLRSAKIAAEEIRVGRGLGTFGQVTVDLADFVDDDGREDPFRTDASRDGLDRRAGSYFSKLMARNPYWTGRRLRVIEGWATDGVWHENDAIVHHYFIRDVQGPSDGALKITAAGPLQLLNLGDREVPAPSRGTLLADLTADAIDATIDPPEDADAYPASGYVRINEEVCAFTRTGAALTLTRGQLGTVADEHQAGDTLQLCVRYEDEPVTEILADVLTTYGGLAEANLALASWAEEQASWLAAYNLTGTISEPTKVLTVVQELLETSAAMLWWDDEAGVLQLRAIRPALAIAGTWGDQFHLTKPVMVKRDLGERVSRCDVLLDLRHAAADAKEPASYRTRLVGDAEGEAATEHGSPAVYVFASRWLNAGQIALAVRASAQVTLSLADGRRTFVCEVAAKDSARKIGDVLDILTRDIVDRTGMPVRTRAVVVKREPIKAGSAYRYTLEAAAFGGRYAFYTAADCPDYDDASAWERDPGGFFSNAAGADFGPNDPAYLFG